MSLPDNKLLPIVTKWVFNETESFGPLSTDWSEGTVRVALKKSDGNIYEAELNIWNPNQFGESNEYVQKKFHAVGASGGIRSQEITGIFLRSQIESMLNDPYVTTYRTMVSCLDDALVSHHGLTNTTELTKSHSAELLTVKDIHSLIKFVEDNKTNWILSRTTHIFAGNDLPAQLRNKGFSVAVSNEMDILIIPVNGGNGYGYDYKTKNWKEIPDDIQLGIQTFANCTGENRIHLDKLHNELAKNGVSENYMSKLSLLYLKNYIDQYKDFFIEEASKNGADGCIWTRDGHEKNLQNTFSIAVKGERIFLLLKGHNGVERLGFGINKAVSLCVDFDEVKTYAAATIIENDENTYNLWKRTDRYPVIEEGIREELSLYEKYARPVGVIPHYFGRSRVNMLNDDKHTISKTLLIDEIADGSLDIVLHQMKVNDVIDSGIEMATTLAKMHEEKICHWDLKPQNALGKFENGKWIFWLSDFGMVVKAGSWVPPGGTVTFMDPELAKATIDKRNVVPRFQHDAFSFGITLLTMLYDAGLFKDVNVAKIMGFDQGEANKYSNMTTAATAIGNNKRLKTKAPVTIVRNNMRNMMEASKDIEISLKRMKRSELASSLKFNTTVRTPKNEVGKKPIKGKNMRTLLQESNKVETILESIKKGEKVSANAMEKVDKIYHIRAAHSEKTLHEANFAEPKNEDSIEHLVWELINPSINDRLYNFNEIAERLNRYKV